MLLRFAGTTNQKCIPTECLLQLLVQEHRGPLVFFAVSSISTRDAKGPGHCGTGVFIMEEVYCVGDRWTRYVTTVNVETAQRSSRLLSS